MKVFEIFEAEEVGTGILDVSGREITRPANTPDAPSNTNSRPSTTPDAPDAKPTIKSARAVSPTELEITVSRANAPDVTIKGKPSEIIDQSLEMFDNRTVQAINRRMEGMADALTRKLQKLQSIKSIGIVFSAGQLYVLWREYCANIAALDILMSDRFFDNNSSDRIYAMAREAYWNAFVAACVIEFGVIIGGGVATVKLIKAIRAFRLVLLAIPGPGWIAALLITLAVEGAWFALTWAFTKYGPQYIADWMASEYREEGGWVSTNEQQMDSSDISELEQQVNRDLQNDRSPVNDESVSRLSTRLQTIQQNSQSGSGAAQPSASQSQSSAVDRLRALRNN